MPFSTRIKIRFGDVDIAGQVYYANVFHYLHIALEEFFLVRCGTGYHELLALERIGFPPVSVKAEFLVPLKYGDEADIEVSVARLGTTSVTLEYTIKRVADGVLCARCTNVLVAMNLDTRKAISIPDKYREAFLSLENS